MTSTKIKKAFCQDNDKPVSEVFDWGNYRVGYFIDKNLGKSSANEDCLFFNAFDGKIFFGVSDGAGGHPRGKDAAFIVGNEVMELNEEKLKKSFAFLPFIESINQKVIDLKAGAKSTLSLGIIYDDLFRSFSVGDSEVIYWNGHGKINYTNIPHSTVGHKIESGVIEQKESLDDPDRNIVHNLMGDEMIRIEGSSGVELKKNQTVLIGTDGLFDNHSHESITSILMGSSFEKGFEDLVNLCLNRRDKSGELDWKKDDDIAFIILRKISST